MLLPKRVKYRRVHRGRLKGKATRGNTVTYGDFGLQALEPAWITSNQIEAARVAMTRYAQRGGKVSGPGHHCVVKGPDGKLWMLYHQKWDTEVNWRRFLALDPLWFDSQGVLHVKVTRDTDQPAPGIPAK